MARRRALSPVMRFGNAMPCPWVIETHAKTVRAMTPRQIERLWAAGIVKSGDLCTEIAVDGTFRGFRLVSPRRCHFSTCGSAKS